MHIAILIDRMFVAPLLVLMEDVTTGHYCTIIPLADMGYYTLYLTDIMGLFLGREIR